MTSQGFPRRLRLLKPKDFSRVFDHVSVKTNHRGLLLLASPNSLNCPRIGFVFSKRNIKLASNRNRTKRIIREQFRQSQHLLPPLDIVVIARRPIANMDNSAIHLLMKRLLPELKRQYEKQSCKS